MIWAKRSFEGVDYLPFSNRLSDLLASHPAFARQFIMVSVARHGSPVSDFYVGLPHRSYLCDFTDFEVVNEDDVPGSIDAIHVVDPACEELKRFELPDRSTI